MSSTHTFGTWVRQRRRELDLTQEELARKVGCSDSTIRRIEGDSRAPSRQLAELLAQGLKIPVAKRPLFLAIARGKRTPDELEGVLTKSTVEEKEPAAIGTTLRSSVQLSVLIPTIPLVGRIHELQKIEHQLEQANVRLVTLTGPGGIGKTLLAIHAAYQQQERFADGACVVELASVAAPAFIAPAILTALQVPLVGGDPLAQLVAYVQDKQLLLVLDNMEHLLSDIDFLLTLLSRAPNLKLLITSRERLNLREEWVIVLDGLPYVYSGEENEESASGIVMFLQHAQRFTSRGDYTHNELLAAERICRAVGGVPLAIELAASWVTTMSWNEIAETLEHDLSLLQTSLRDVPTRHQSILAVFDHSWSLLTTEEQRVLRQLSVFRGAFSRAAAAAVTGTTLPTLRRLIEKSLVRHSGDDRYTLHELVRQYAALQRDRAQEEAAVRDAHLDYYVHLAEEADPWLRSGERYRWLAILEPALDDIRAALEWGLGDTARTHKALRLAGALKWFWYFAGYWIEGTDWLARVLAQTPSTDRSAARAKTLTALALLRSYRGDYASARQYAEASIILWRELDDQSGLALTLLISGYIILYRGDVSTAIQWLEESITLYRKLEDQWGLALALTISAYIPHALGDLEQAQELFSESITRWHTVADPWGLMMSLNNLADIALSQGNVHDAAILYRETTAHIITHRLVDEFTPWMLYGLARIALHEQNLVAAKEYLIESWPYVRQLRHARLRDSLLITIAGMYIIRGQAERGVQFLGVSLRSCADDSVYMRSVDRYYYEYYLAIARAQLDDVSITKALEEGQTWPPLQTLENALTEIHQEPYSSTTL